MEKYLKGVDGVKKVVTDSLGNVSSEQIITEASSGKDVTLTIDYRIQNVVENALKNTLWNLQTGGYGKEPIYEAQSGSCVVLDVFCVFCLKSDAILERVLQHLPITEV